MNPDTLWLLYLTAFGLLAVVAMVLVAMLGSTNTDRDEALQEQIERERLPIMLRRQAD